MTLSTVVTGTPPRSDAAKVTRHLDAARSALDATVWQLATETSEVTGYTWHATDDAPNDYESLVTAYYLSGLCMSETYRSLPVWSGGSDRTLYGSAGHNYAFRFWHDMGHIAHDLSFTFGDERRLQERHHIAQVSRALDCIVGWHSPEVKRLALELYRADTIGQLEYSARWHRFPDDQLSFDVAYAIDSDSALGKGGW